MCKEGVRQGQSAARSSAPSKSYKKKSNKTCNYSYGRAPVLREPWRTSPKARHTLGSAGMSELKLYLEEEIRVVPQQGTPELPVLYVSPAELIRHILARQSAMTGNQKAGAGMFVEVYGGVAQAVVSVDTGNEDWTQPTDFDARFYIARTGNDGWDFDRCRFFVEEYLLMKLQLASPVDSELRYATPGVVRGRYYQKQVMIGGSFSLLSVGDPSTGKAIDLEFSTNSDGRKYFDDANSFVIPLSLQQLAGMSPAVAMSMTGSFEHAIDLTHRKELLVNNPSQVVNGLALYAHAVTTKQLTAASADAEDSCARELVQSFLEQSHTLRARFEDPLRFLRSFLRSHYTARPLSALASVVQLCSEIAAYEDLVELPEGLEEHRDGQMDLSWMVGELLADLLLAAVEHADAEVEAMLAVLKVAAFARSPGGAARDEEEERAVRVEVGGGEQAVRLRRKEHACEGAREQCETAADCLARRVGGSMPGWQQSLVAEVCGLLRGEAGSEEEQALPEEAAVARSLARRLEEAGEAGLAEELTDMYMCENAEAGEETEEEAEEEAEAEIGQSSSEEVLEMLHGRGESQKSAARQAEADHWVGDHKCREEAKVVKREDDDDHEAQKIPHKVQQGSLEGAAVMRKIVACCCRLENTRVWTSGTSENAYPLRSLTALPALMAPPNGPAEAWNQIPRLVRVQAG